MLQNRESTIKNVIFDMGNVLLDYAPRAYCHRIISDPGAAETVYRELFEGEEWKQMDAGAITEEEATGGIRKRIPQYADSLNRALEFWPSANRVMPGMTEIVSRLRANRYHLFLLSNTSLRFYQFHCCFEIFSFFDGFLISAREKLMKPDPAIYRLLFSRFQLIPDECLFIDDMQANIDGAARVGMPGHLFSGPEDLSLFFRQRGIL